MTSPVSDCAACQPSHPLSVHLGAALGSETGACTVPGCPCVRFTPAGSQVRALPVRCYLCDRIHATGVCPLVPHKC